MTLEPRFDSPDPSKRKIMYWVCSETGSCFSTNEVSLAGSIPTTTPKPKSRIDTEKSLTEILLGDKPYDS